MSPALRELARLLWLDLSDWALGIRAADCEADR